jgi:hypothetical protein
LAAGAWCLACFVLVNAYSSVLISFVVAPNLKPIIDSVKDIPKNKGWAMVVEKGTTLEAQLLVYSQIITERRYLLTFALLKIERT